MAAKKIIVLAENVSETEITYNVLFWFPIVANPVTQTAGSQWTASGTSAGASAAENSAIQAGTVKEESFNFPFPVGTAPATIESFLQQAWTNRNAQINGQGGDQFYGFWWDGTVWSNS